MRPIKPYQPGIMLLFTSMDSWRLSKKSRKYYESLLDMVNKYEKPDSTYHLEDVDDKYIMGMSKGIVGFKIQINKIEGKAKLSQNHTTNRQELVIKQLEKSLDQNNIQIAELMKKNLLND